MLLGAGRARSLQLPCSEHCCLTSLTLHRVGGGESEEEGLRAKGLFFQAAVGREQLDLVYVRCALQSQPSSPSGVLPQTQQHLKELPCQPQVINVHGTRQGSNLHCFFLVPGQPIVCIHH